MKTALIREATARDLPGLRAMYQVFEPKEEFQGLPPASANRLAAWLKDHFTAREHHLVAVVGRKIVGHAMLCDGPEPGEAELAVFLHQAHRGRGLGKQLLLATLHFGCKTLALDRVWLSVEGANPRALHVFESIGFRAPANVADSLAWELEMARPSHCAKCRGNRCEVFSHAPPLATPLRAKPASCADSR